MQENTFTREQAIGCGVSDKTLAGLIARGAASRAHPGLYCWGSPSGAFGQRAWLAHHLGGPDSALGGRAALVVGGAGAQEPATIVVWSPVAGLRSRAEDVLLRTDRAGRLAHRRGTLPVIRPEDALVDLYGDEGLDPFIAAATEAIRRGRTSPRHLERTVVGRSRVRARRHLLGVLADLSGTESGLEYRYLQMVERAHGLPRAERQVSLARGSRTDVWYPEYGVLVELDGRAGHLDGWHRDLDRDNRHALRALTTLRYGSADVWGRPCQVAAQVAAALRLRGWAGELRRCHGCPVHP